ncbi:MAG: hypothetical protein CMJ31_00485 [Phycisphaerae bacterium]|nr:hypothetical protein [Phycisphaerae bacterium]
MIIEKARIAADPATHLLRFNLLAQPIRDTLLRPTGLPNFVGNDSDDDLWLFVSLLRLADGSEERFRHGMSPLILVVKSSTFEKCCTINLL